MNRTIVIGFTLHIGIKSFKENQCVICEYPSFGFLRQQQRIKHANVIKTTMQATIIPIIIPIDNSF
jgi:hypothetical protein